MKNKVITVILVILMLIPTVVAITNYALLQGGQADTHNTVEVRLTDHHGNTFTFTRDSANGEMLNYFIKTLGDAEEVSALPTSIEMGNYYTVDMVTTAAAINDDPISYKFYYTTSTADCYFFGGKDAKAYRIAEEDAEKFINGPYAACLFENGIAPSLTLSGKTAYPDDANWNFKNSTGEYVAYDCTAMVKNENEAVSLEGGLAMEFSLEPDSLSLKITDKKTSQVYEKLEDLNITSEMDVAVEAVATWHKDDERTYFGEQTYKFEAVLGAPAKFYAGVTDIQVGEFICITGVNVNNPENITFKSEPEINYTPVFFKEGEYVQTLVPFNWDLDTGDYVLTLSYGGSTQQINVTVGERNNKFLDRSLTMTGSTTENFGTEEKRQEAETELRKIAKLSSDKRYWENGETLHYDDSDLTFALGYGHTYSVNGTDISFRNTGVDFRVSAGTEIGANLAGEVIYAGILDYSGFCVVIEHGYGLKSWYAHLGSTEVNVGDVVEKGDTIGTAGASGFTSVEGVHIGMTIYDVPVCTYAIWKNSYRTEDEKGIVMYEGE